jgi:hypothetical protein
MPHFEAILAYARDSMGRNCAAVPIGRTSDPVLLKALRDRLIAEAEGEARMWHGVDPVLGEMAATEVERLERIFELIPPCDERTPGLRLVEDDE